ncbi:MAG: nickel pincer cofactor biosynthesis protein LarB [Selenomonadaceae bacterium]|nr:nickel pincer cofactor biosynthesis protein LarB [Selenomonadaceae bacterium]MBR1858241.1 nickel pincer cofactor biosynthesis protein LarB [Selenomonadaceae bacterium]
MDEQSIRSLLQDYKAGQIDESIILSALKKLPLTAVEDIGFASIDHYRELRQGFPEVIYAAGKTKEQVLTIMQSLYDKSKGNLMATRASVEQFEYVSKVLPVMKYDEAARMIYVDRDKRIKRDKERTILILTAGTSDIPVAEEARLTAYLWGNEVKTHYDCGVAGIHRLFAHINDIESANVLIVVAGMEGALASVVGGLTDKPVIAVPTSVGYGASFNGIAALLAMLNSCAAGVSVVNIDNGFGAGVLASKINRLR